MHPFLLIPLLSAVACMALGAAIGARGPDRAPNRLAARLLGLAGVWSLCQVLWCTAEGAEAALQWSRIAAGLSLLMAPLALQLLRSIEPTLRERLRPLVAPSWILTVTALLFSIFSSASISHMRPVPWGFTPVSSPTAAVAFLAVTVLPLWGVLQWIRYCRPQTGDERRRALRIALVTGLTFVICTAIETILPLLGGSMPRLTGAPIAIWGSVTFWNIYRYRAPIFDPRSFAREILEIVPVGVLLVRDDGTIRSTNRVLAELAGAPAGELAGTPLEALLCEAHETPSAGPANERERELLCRDGSRVPVSVSDAELCDVAGERAGYVLVVRDLREVISLRNRLLTSGRLAAVGQLAAGIAHEINNPIAYVHSNLGLLERHWAEVETLLGKEPQPESVAQSLDEGHGLIGECFEGVDRVAAIVRDVGGFSRAGGAQLEASNLCDLLDAAVRVATPLLRSRATLERDYEPLPLAHCVPQEIMQVFLNLLLNASQALDGPGNIRLRTRSDAQWVRVRIEDDGHGIAAEHLARIFDAFFTTKPVGEGTGLGLAISRQIIEKHGGEIEAVSTPGSGTAFEVRLPTSSDGEGVVEGSA